MAIRKNVAGQKLGVFAYNKTSGAAVTGDAANITAYLSKDFGAAAATNDVNPTELDSTNMAGWYYFDMTQAETNAETMILAPKSATADVLLDPLFVPTADDLVALEATAQDILTDTGTTLDGLIKDVPTVAEFEARTIAAANYATASALATVDEIVDDILTDTGTTIPATLANLALEATAQSILEDTTEIGVAGAGLTAADDAVIAAIAALNNLSSAGAQAAAAAALAAYGAATATNVTNATSPLATAAAVAALNNLSQAQAQAAATAALNAYDGPTKTEMDAAFTTADDAVLAAIAALNNTSATDFLTALQAMLVDGAITWMELQRVLLALIAGKTTGGGTTDLAFLAQDGLTERIAATVDGSGNRTSVTLDGGA